MDQSTQKSNEMQNYDPKTIFKTYLSANSDSVIQEQAFKYPMRRLYKDIASVSCDVFEEITVLELNEHFIKELEKWMNKEEDALDWTHASQFACALEGKSDGWKKKEEKLRSRIKCLVKVDFAKENLSDPIVLPKSDCLFCMWVLDVTSKDHDAYCRNLKKISSLLKLDGQLILFGTLNATYYMAGEKKCHILKYNEVFLRQALAQAGYVIECFEMTEGKQPSEYIFYEHFVYVRAEKKKES
ncbi:nicotinamide N-methyltransferase-like [Rhinophrynus dorsalis]